MIIGALFAMLAQTSFNGSVLFILFNQYREIKFSRSLISIYMLLPSCILYCTE